MKPDEIKNIIPNCIPLAHVVKVYVPSTVYNKEIDSSVYVARFGGLLSDLFGGATVTDSVGYYKAQSGELICETVHIVYAFAESLTAESLKSVIDAVNYMKNELQQECVSVEIDNKLYFI